MVNTLGNGEDVVVHILVSTAIIPVRTLGGDGDLIGGDGLDILTVGISTNVPLPVGEGAHIALPYCLLRGKEDLGSNRRVVLGVGVTSDAQYSYGCKHRCLQKILYIFHF